jgi:hypothetical protein
MRLTPLILVLAGVLMAGCAGHSADCALGTSVRGDCAPGTEGHARMMQQQQDAKATAAIDDARCRSYGGDPGSPAYIECRRQKMSDRKLFGVPDAPEARPLPKSN